MATSPQIEYDRLADDYAGHRRPLTGVVERLREVATIGQASVVLELGCGTGNQVVALAAATGCQACGVDRSAGMLAHARGRGAPVEFTEASAETLPFVANRFDLAFSVDVIHHIEHRDRLFAEALRVLKPGGRLCTATHSEALLRQSGLVLRRYFPETIEVDVARYPAIDALRHEMAAAGFSEIGEEIINFPAVVTDSRAYAAKAFSSLHLIPEAAFARGLAKLDADLRAGPITGTRQYLLLWGRKPN